MIEQIIAWVIIVIGYIAITTIFGMLADTSYRNSRIENFFLGFTVQIGIAIALLSVAAVFWAVNVLFTLT